ncbi:hypothetical protein D3C80_916690 [compost metagenome]
MQDVAVPADLGIGGALRGNDRHVGADLEAGRAAAAGHQLRALQDIDAVVAGLGVEPGAEVRSRKAHQQTAAANRDALGAAAEDAVAADVRAEQLHAQAGVVGQGDLGDHDLDHHLGRRGVQRRQKVAKLGELGGRAGEDDAVAAGVDQHLSVHELAAAAAQTGALLA